MPDGSTCPAWAWLGTVLPDIARPVWLASAGWNTYIVLRSDRSAATALPRPETGPRAMRDRRKPKRLPRDYHHGGAPTGALCCIQATAAGDA